MKYLPYVLAIVAFGALFGHARIEEPVLRRLCGLLFWFLAGGATLLWGVNELRSGQALVETRYASRARQPFVFWTVIIVFRFALGAMLFAAGLWYLAVKALP